MDIFTEPVFSKEPAGFDGASMGQAVAGLPASLAWPAQHWPSPLHSRANKFEEIRRMNENGPGREQCDGSEQQRRCSSNVRLCAMSYVSFTEGRTLLLGGIECDKRPRMAAPRVAGCLIAGDKSAQSDGRVPGRGGAVDLLPEVFI